MAKLRHVHMLWVWRSASVPLLSRHDFSDPGLYSPGNRIERCLSYDEKPLLLFQKLKDARKEPVFVLKHIKDIRSPIAVAQQKHAARKQMSGETHSLAGQPGADHGQWAASGAGQVNAANSRPSLRPRPEVGDLAAGGSGAALAPSASAHPAWLEVMSPTISGSDAGTAPTSTPGTGPPTLHRSASGRFRTGSASATGDGEREMPLPSAGVSYAVAIYPYMAEQDDEFDVVVYVSSNIPC
jgi:protein STE50